MSFLSPRILQELELSELGCPGSEKQVRLFINIRAFSLLQICSTVSAFPSNPNNMEYVPQNTIDMRRSEIYSMILKRGLQNSLLVFPNLGYMYNQSFQNLFLKTGAQIRAERAKASIKKNPHIQKTPHFRVSDISRKSLVLALLKSLNSILWQQKLP